MRPPRLAVTSILPLALAGDNAKERDNAHDGNKISSARFGSDSVLGPCRLNVRISQANIAGRFMSTRPS
jgi:hypothetical protein